MKESGTVDWRRYYDIEGETKKFLPGHEDAEEMRVDFVSRLLGGTQVESVLDVGCGNGYLASVYAARGVGRVLGVDYSRPRLADGRTRFPSVRFARSSATALPLAAKSVDLVSMVEVLEHLPEPLEALRELKRVARRLVLVTVPYRGKIIELVCPHCAGRFHYDGHIHSFDERKLAGLVEEAGLGVVRLETYVPSYPPGNPLLRALPGSLSDGLRRSAVALKLRPPVPPKYLGVVATP